MRSINLFSFINASSCLDADALSLFESVLSKRNSSITIKSAEIKTLSTLIDKLILSGTSLAALDNFFYSFSIPQISKEFDLLKICNSHILNIELKSKRIPIDGIKNQLLKNKHYLAPISSAIHLITYLEEDDIFYSLNDQNELREIKLEEVKCILEQSVENCLFDSIEKLFLPSRYLVSPINSPEVFVEDSYFLTSQQDEIKQHIQNKIKKSSSYEFFSITGAAGTGKTLLLYDIAKSFDSSKKACIIHCGMLAQGHETLNSLLHNVDIIAIKNVTTETLSQYDFLFVDEAHRIYPYQLDLIISITKEQKKYCVFSSDSKQVLSKKETKRAIGDKLNTIKQENRFNLSGKIRTNKMLVSFVKKLFYTKDPTPYESYDNIQILSAKDLNIAKQYIEYLQGQGYEYIEFTPSMYSSHQLDQLAIGKINTHGVIGQEFDKVVMVIDKSFLYWNDHLNAYAHPNPDYLFTQLLFQGVTRAREHLALIVLDNPEVFETLTKILCHSI